MIISFRCPPQLREKIEKLIQSGLYPDLSSFCTAAIENLLLLEEHIPESKGERVPTKAQKTTPAKPPKDKATHSVSESAVSPSVVSSEPPAGNLAFPSELAAFDQNSRVPFTLPVAVADLFKVNDRIPVDRWLFGQYNRVFPAKVTLRALSNIAMNEGKETLVLDGVGARIAEIAAIVGGRLRSLDRRFATHRDDAFATAFPDPSLDGQKGRMRYQNHFVGHTVKGEQGGLPVGLKLAVIHVLKNKPHILPTSAGWSFALLPNPILDNPSAPIEERLTKMEREFLLAHIRDQVPVELFAYRALLSMLSQGIDSPDAMNSALMSLLSEDRKADDSREFVNTQRAGVLGRMTDLGLISHERDGRFVRRQMTEVGRKFLAEVGSSEFAKGA
jgi:Arc/MetJ-type ribon-helix-helix transcriptional regulator